MLLSVGGYVFLDVAYIAGALKPILNHKTNEKKRGIDVFSGRELQPRVLKSQIRLSKGNLLMYRDELVKKGILNREFAAFLWEDPGRKEDVPQASLQKILVDLGVAIPLPEGQVRGQGMSIPTWCRPHPSNLPNDDCTDLLILMRLNEEPTSRMRDDVKKLSDELTETHLKAVWEFKCGGAPYGFPEAVIAFCHRLGDVSNLCWRHGALFTREEDGQAAKAKSLVIFDKSTETLTFETMGREEWDYVSLRFAVSAVRYVTRDFSGAVWDGHVACTKHEGRKMYYLASSSDLHDGPKV